jgi:hypothetical protein
MTAATGRDGGAVCGLGSCAASRSANTATPVVTDATGGIITVTLAPAASTSVDPGTYVRAVQSTDAAGETWEFPGPSQAPGLMIVKQSIVVATS